MTRTKRSRTVYRYKGSFKAFLFILGVAIVLGFIYYNQLLVRDLQRQSQAFQNFKVELFEENINNDEVTDLNFFFSNVIQTADYPIIYTDPDLQPQFWSNLDIAAPTAAELSEAERSRLQDLMTEFQQDNPPIPIQFQGNVLGYYFYGESFIVRKLRWLPLIQIVVVGLFILIGYAGFRSIKRSEERFIWVGMAKETAHQLGTPLSAQIGWLEYLKSSPDSLSTVLPELEKDLKRLQVVTNRFSQIGSLPDLKAEDPVSLIRETVTYFQSRIPRKSGTTHLDAVLDDTVGSIHLNSDLFSWVLENLIKNGLDALENKGGRITVTLGAQDERFVFVDVSDTGKGIAAGARKEVFKPGFSTKKRGWGLGLSLARRIIEDYHGGRLLLKESQPGQGTTFRILLRRETRQK